MWGRPPPRLEPTWPGQVRSRPEPAPRPRRVKAKAELDVVDGRQVVRVLSDATVTVSDPDGAWDRQLTLRAGSTLTFK